MAETMTPEKAAALREPFPASAIGKLPKPYKKDNPKGDCRECGGYHGLPAAHLDYVGHAAATARLLAVDPCWTWEPYGTTAEGLPLVVNGGLWIKLTVCGVTRPGYGDGASIKEMIGDAIRNAAMRFGVALDLWAKEDLHDIEHPPEPVDYATPAQQNRIAGLLDDLDDEAKAKAKAWWRSTGYPSLRSGNLTADQAQVVIAHLVDETDDETAEADLFTDEVAAGGDAA